MKIAIIGWGSLVWDPRELPREGVWSDGGPELPVEFSRISKDARLTLVIDSDHGKAVRTMHVPSPRTALSDAREDLRQREGTSERNIGWVDVSHGTDSLSTHNHQTPVHDAVKKWCQDSGYDGAVWTALGSNFKKETDVEFSVDAALYYIKQLPKNVRAEALKYIRNAPRCVETETRQRVMKEFGEQ